MEIAGIKIRIHTSFLVVMVIVLLAGGLQSAAALVVLFAFVVLHELSHSLVARAHGVHVQDITLLPIGGVARLSQMPEAPRAEFLIAVAGPALNFVIAALAFGVQAMVGTALGHGVAALIDLIIFINLALGTFNLLPAFPMDGGRLLRAYLATRLDYVGATRVAARVGRWIAAAMAIFGVLALFVSAEQRGPFWSPWLLVLAAFIYVSGKAEELSVIARHAQRGLWRLFEYGMPGGPAPAEPDPPRAAPDVIDVEGTVRPDPRRAAADAFRQLADGAANRPDR